jgi:hypothetical protein
MFCFKKVIITPESGLPDPATFITPLAVVCASSEKVVINDTKSISDSFLIQLILNNLFYVALHFLSKMPKNQAEKGRAS